VCLLGLAKTGGSDPACLLHSCNHGMRVPPCTMAQYFMHGHMTTYQGSRATMHASLAGMHMTPLDLHHTCAVQVELP
jgi:hypothetical protein